MLNVRGCSWRRRGESGGKEERQLLHKWRLTGKRAGVIARERSAREGWMKTTPCSKCFHSILLLREDGAPDTQGRVTGPAEDASLKATDCRVRGRKFSTEI